MELKLTKPVFFFDLETTGTSITNDRIVEICLLKVFPDGREQAKTYRVNPGMPIPPAATAVHHITDEDVVAVVEALKSDYMTQGPRIGEFVKTFADYLVVNM